MHADRRVNIWKENVKKKKRRKETRNDPAIWQSRNKTMTKSNAGHEIKMKVYLILLFVRIQRYEWFPEHRQEIDESFFYSKCKFK